MSRESPKWPLAACALLVMLVVFAVRWTGWIFPAPPPSLPAPPAGDIIPPSIIVTEESTPSGAGREAAPGMRDLAGYAQPGGNDSDDMRMLAHTIGAFLTINKQAAERPLSANEEWSASLRGQRPNTFRWFEDSSPVFSPVGKLVDRHGTPLHFHALGGGAWEIRSAGLDRKLFTDDDAIGSVGRDKS